MPEGTYQISLTEPAGRGGRKRVREAKAFRVASDLTVTAPSKTQKWAGLALAIVGMPSIPIGIGVSASGAATCDDGYDEEYGEEYWVCTPANLPLVTAGLGLLIGGIIATPVGWVTFGRNRYPRVKPTAAPTTASLAPPRWELGLQPLGTGYGLGARVKF